MENSLYCIHCNHTVDWVKKSSIIDHLKSTKHLKCKLNHKESKLQLTLEKSVSQMDFKHKIVMDFVEMIVSANIPLEKKDKMNDWLNKYVPHSGCIPTGNTLRQTYLPEFQESQIRN